MLISPHSFVSDVKKDIERDESDDLVYWRTYGKEGEGCSLKLTCPWLSIAGKSVYGADEVKCPDRLLKSVWDTLYETLNPLIGINGQPIIDVQEKLAGRSS